MKAWWLARDLREQMILGAGAVILVVILVWLLAWNPLISKASMLKTSVDQQQETLVWMRETAGEVIALRSQGGHAAAGLQGRSLLAVVDQSVRQAGFTSSLKRVEPEGGNKVRLRLEDVAFDALMLWMEQISRQYGVAASQVSVEPVEEAGRVTVRLTLVASLI